MATPYLTRISSASISRAPMTGVLARARLEDLGVRPATMALENTIDVRAMTFAARCPTSMRTPSSARRLVMSLLLAGRSPTRRTPACRRISARPLMPIPPIPTKMHVANATSKHARTSAVSAGPLAPLSVRPAMPASAKKSRATLPRRVRSPQAACRVGHRAREPRRPRPAPSPAREPLRRGVALRHHDRAARARQRLGIAALVVVCRAARTGPGSKRVLRRTAPATEPAPERAMTRSARTSSLRHVVEERHDAAARAHRALRKRAAPRRRDRARAWCKIVMTGAMARLSVASARGQRLRSSARAPWLPPSTSTRS